MIVNEYEIKPRADLSNANLSFANLKNNDLSKVNFRDANLFCANVSYSNLRHVKANNTNLCYANLFNSNLSFSNLRNAQLEATIMEGANLYCTKLGESQKCRKGEKLKQDIIGFKKCYINQVHDKRAIVELMIPRGAIVFGINGDNFRTDKARVKAIYDMDGKPLQRAYSMHKYFSHYVGDEIEIFNFNCEYNVECAEGKHFFKTLEEAEKY